MSDSNMRSEKITLRWLHDHVPVTGWWWYAAIVLFAICTVSFGLGASETIRKWLDNTQQVDQVGLVREPAQ